MRTLSRFKAFKLKCNCIIAFIIIFIYKKGVIAYPLKLLPELTIFFPSFSSFSIYHFSVFFYFKYIFKQAS
jgi:hypothetical protein